MSNATDFNNFIPLKDHKFRLGSVINWEIGAKGSGWLLKIPPGFVFDSSVPRGLWWVRSPDYRPWLLAAAVHDWLLENGYDRAFAAGEWLRAVRAKDPGSKLALVAYYGIVGWTVNPFKSE